MRLSIIIVNYNVSCFLEQCLFSVRKAISGIEAEVIVADNCSTDGSVDRLSPVFPEVRFMVNDHNLGFAKANNQALALCGGEYVLFLNPDTLVPENALQKCLLYMNEHPEAGALGVRMIDGKGRFLAESKRSFPSPVAAFYKLVGLAAIFPRSGIFNQYALGDLDQHQNHDVAVLAGACMIARKKILDDLKGFDERYFMYGEDIDLSYRIKQAGFQNHYFAGTTILHFKGKNSRRQSLAHVKNFYGAMQVFVDKQYAKKNEKTLAFFIHSAISFRAALSFAGWMIGSIFPRKKNSLLSDQMIIVATPGEYEQVLLIAEKRPLGRVSIHDGDEDALCSLRELAVFREKTTAKEILFCEGALTLSAILIQLELLKDNKTRFLFHMQGSGSIVGNDFIPVKP